MRRGSWVPESTDSSMEGDRSCGGGEGICLGGDAINAGESSSPARGPSWPSGGVRVLVPGLFLGGGILRGGMRSASLFLRGNGRTTWLRDSASALEFAFPGF